MDTSFLLGAVLNGVLGSSKKRSRRARTYLTGNGRLLSNPAMLMTAAGLAWGVIDTLQQSRAGAGGGADAGSGPSGDGGPPPPGAAHSVPHATSSGSQPLPPLPPGHDAPGPQQAAWRMIRLAISAAYADGTMSEKERAAILQQATAAGLSEEAAAELSRTQPLATIVAGISGPEEAATLYVLAFTILRADEQVSGSERIYLAQLASALQLERSTVEALERDTGARIDALGDQGQLGG